MSADKPPINLEDVGYTPHPFITCCRQPAQFEGFDDAGWARFMCLACFNIIIVVSKGIQDAMTNTGGQDGESDEETDEREKEAGEDDGA